MNNKAMYNISYGLYVLTAREGEKDNGCITNTLVQVTSTPNRVSVAVNKQNLTHDMIMRTGLFNVSMITQEAPFSLFQHFGFRSGRDCEKFADWDGMGRAANDIFFIARFTNSYISAQVYDKVDLGTHTLFLADVTDGEVLSSLPSVTYSYYQANIKPKPQPKKKGWVCKVCGYVYEGDPLPADFICPICKHGASDFEPLG